MKSDQKKTSDALEILNRRLERNPELKKAYEKEKKKYMLYLKKKNRLGILVPLGNGKIIMKAKSFVGWGENQIISE